MSPPVRSGGQAASAHAASTAAGVILAAAMLFNAVLAIVNGHIMALGVFPVAATQATLTLCCILLALIMQPGGVARWFVYLWVAVCGFLLLAVLRDRLDLRYLSDMLTIIAFVMLGMVIRRATLITVLMGLQAAIVVVAIWELISPQGFADAFMVKSYYVNTRGFLEDAVWSGPENLYLAAERPTGRLIGAGLEIHRASSLFLEPVCLGNWTVVVTLAVAALRTSLTRFQIGALLVTNLILLFACDGRLSLALNIMILAAWPILPRIPQWITPLFLPAIFVLLLVLGSIGALGDAGDTLGGRFLYGVDYLTRLDVPQLFGLYDKGGIVAADSGWAYMILTQSIFGLAAVWLVLTLQLGERSVEQRRFVNGMAIFVALSLPISYSIFSIKTAAMLWAIYGHITVAKGQAATALSNKPTY